MDLRSETKRSAHGLLARRDRTKACFARCALEASHNAEEPMANSQQQADMGRTPATMAPQMQSEPKPPFPEQHQDGPGLESKL